MRSQACSRATRTISVAATPSTAIGSTFTSVIVLARSAIRVFGLKIADGDGEIHTHFAIIHRRFHNMKEDQARPG